MKPTRILASATLLVSSIALITAAGISVGDEPGVVRMGEHSPPANSPMSPTPDAVGPGVACLDGGSPEPYMGMYPQPAPYAPYFERSYGATQQIPRSAYQSRPPFGPVMMLESNIGDGLGYEQSYQRLSARIPYHIIPNANVLIGDISASVTNNGDPLGNVGLIYRNYDSLRNRIFGWNAYGDYDQGIGNGDWYQVGGGFESLGEHLDFRVNGYQAVGSDSMLLSSTLSNNIALIGNGAFKVRNEVRDNAYSGLQAEAGGPLPVLGEYGLDMFLGAYYLHNDAGKDATGFQARWQAMITESLRVNTYLTTDRTFGVNSWVSLQYDLPNYKNRRVLRRSTVRERLQDPVVRDNRIHVHRDSRDQFDAVINSITGVGYNFLHVDPNRTTVGTGAFENPFSTLQAAAFANNANVDIIRVGPRLDDSGTNLTVNGGISLFDDQTLLSSLKPLTLAPDCIIPADTGLTTTLGPLISNPTMVAGGSVVRIRNNDSIIGMRIDASNAAGTVFGNGIVNPLPITDANVTCNIFTNYTNGALLRDVSGRIIVDENEFNGLAGASSNGLDLTAAGGSTIELLVQNNRAVNNSGTGLSIIAQPGSTINANDPNGTAGPATGIVNNTTSDNGTGILTEARTGATINAVVEGNVSINNTSDGFVGRADGGTYNLDRMASNTFSNNLGNGAFIHFLNGGVFNSVSEDLNGNGTLDAGEDLNGNGRLGQGIVSNSMNQNSIAGLCIFGENASTGVFDIGGPTAALGNTFLGNTYAGIATDLRDTSTAQIDALFNTISGDPTAHGIIVNAQDNAQLLPSTFNNNTITGASQDGIAIVMNDNAVAQGVTIQSNTITNGGGNGIRLEANGPGAVIHATNAIGGTGTNVYGGTSYTQGNTISNNAGDGFRALAANGGTIDGNLLNNTITDNGGDGAAFLIDNGGFIDFGTLPNRRIAGNTITGNTGAGILFNQFVAADNEAQLDATVIGNTISNNLGGGIVANVSGANNAPPFPPAIVTNNSLNLTIGGNAVGNANTINGNSDVGIGVNVTGNGKAVVDIINTSVTGTIDGPDPLRNGDGLSLTRSDASLLLATVTNSTFTGNAGDGMDVDAQGNDRFDPNQPMSGTANMVTVLNSIFNNNGGNGAQFRIHGDATLIGDMTRSTFNNNGQNGVLVNTSETSSFGDPTDGLPPGRRSIFDGNTYNENGVDGVQLVATEDSRVLVEITSNRLAAASPAHAGANTNGDTSISRNGGDGVRIDTTGGRSDILITSGTGQTTIDGNGTTAGGNGIRWNSSGNSDGLVRVTRTIITNNIAGISEDTNANGVLDPGEDLNGNNDIDVADGDGLQANFSGNATAVLVVGNIGEGNVIQSNGDDGIAVNASGNARPIITITSNTIGGSANGLADGNRGDGVSLNVVGGTATGIAPAAVDFTLPGLSPDVGVNASGPVPQFTMNNNLVSNNNHRGLNMLFNGGSGTRDRENGNSFFDPIVLNVLNNTIDSNGDEGVVLRADADMNQSRFVYLANFPDPPETGFQNLNYDPNRPEFLALNVGSVNGNTAYQPPYLNLRTVQNSYLTMTGNVVRNNGKNQNVGQGIRIDVGTGAYVAADLQNNVFGGNLDEDVVTSSFLSAGNTFTSVDTTGDLTFDYVYLDDTAQLDMRFQNNSGNQIAPSDAGATYTNFDPLKFSGAGLTNRDAAFFQVDNGPALNDPNNTFIDFGVTQNIQNAFNTGGYNLRGAADPMFPNIGFAPFLP